MNCRIFLWPAASRDIDEVAEYLAEHQDLKTGLRFYRAAEETFRLIATQPKMGTRTAFRSSHLKDVRRFPLKRFPNHLVFYRFTGTAIEIIRVLHGARDIEAVLDEFTQGGEGAFGKDPTEVT